MIWFGLVFHGGDARGRLGGGWRLRNEEVGTVWEARKVRCWAERMNDEG